MALLRRLAGELRAIADYDEGGTLPRWDDTMLERWADRDALELASQGVR